LLDQYRREVLPNGLRVIGVERPALHYFACSVYVHAGPRFETAAELGLTHFLEHMLVQGSENYPSSSSIMRGIEDLGGVIDAQTSPEFLHFAFGVHRKHWRKALAIAGDVLLHPLFDEAEIEQEKGIIAQEISQHRDLQGRNISGAELAYGLLFKEAVSEAGTRGAVQITEGFDRDAVLSHYRRFFTPQNMVICLAGGFKFDEVFSDLQDHFSRAPAGSCPAIIGAELQERRARAVFRMTEALPVVELFMCHHAYPIADERFDALRAVSQLLGGGLSSRLFTHVREELGLVYDIDSHIQAYSDAGSLDVSLSVGVGNLFAAFEAVLDELQRTSAGNFTTEELARYKESVRCGIDILCDRPTQLADWFGRQELLLGSDNIVTPRKHVRAQEALTLARLSDAMDDVLCSSGANLAVVGPFGDCEAAKLRELFPAEEATVAPVE
jgi:predicted Zn-dependent peptidase